VPGAEGKAGMAAIVSDGTLDLPALHAHLAARLPPYARPLFVRLTSSLDSTGTFRQRKTDLAGEGYAATRDPVWFDDRAAGAYRPCDATLIARLEQREIPL
jgi:fatty-acyl-CoA synthase